MPAKHWMKYGAHRKPSLSPSCYCENDIILSLATIVSLGKHSPPRDGFLTISVALFRSEVW